MLTKVDFIKEIMYKYYKYSSDFQNVQIKYHDWNV